MIKRDFTRITIRRTVIRVSKDEVEAILLRELDIAGVSRVVIEWKEDPELAAEKDFIVTLTAEEKLEE